MDGHLEALVQTAGSRRALRKLPPGLPPEELKRLEALVTFAREGHVRGLHTFTQLSGDTGDHWLSGPLPQGRTSEVYLSGAPCGPGRWDVLSDLLPGVLSALRTLHQAGHRHLAVRPQTLRISPTGEGSLSDLGLAITPDPWTVAAGPEEVASWWSFCAPEQVEPAPGSGLRAPGSGLRAPGSGLLGASQHQTTGARPVGIGGPDPGTEDVYALALCLLHLARDRHPPRSLHECEAAARLRANRPPESPNCVRRALPPEVLLWLEGILVPRVEDRPRPQLALATLQDLLPSPTLASPGGR